MKISFLAIGDELLSGKVADANGKYIADKAALHGLEMRFMLAAGDDETEIVAAFNFLVGQSDVVIVSGGLGPTPDDLTIEVFARYMGVELEFHAEVMEKIDLRFKLRNIPTPEANKKQAMIPKGAKIIENPVGTAPGIEAQFKNCFFLFLPGVPSEFRKMTDDSIIPRLRALDHDQKSLAMITLRTFGLPESGIADRLAKLSFDPRVKIAYLPELPEIYLRATAMLKDKDEALRVVNDAAQKIKAELKEYVFSDADEPMEVVVGKLLKAKGLTLATAESCTSGLVAKKITDIPGSSDYFLGGFVTYANQLKASALGVSADLLKERGAVDMEVARQMAKGAREKTGADLAISITGIAGPTGGTKDKPVGLVFMALASGEGIWSQKFMFLPWSRLQVRELSAETAMEIVRRKILGLRMPGEKV
jgi:nicotinamide-nucleotide amidase